jgi:hypothetical protein
LTVRCFELLLLQGVIVMAATNLPETLDPALKRPGRFDRQVSPAAAPMSSCAAAQAAQTLAASPCASFFSCLFCAAASGRCDGKQVIPAAAQHLAAEAIVPISSCSCKFC